MITKKSGVKPDEHQLELMDRRFGMFIHFGINTFADCEWSDGSLSKSLYCPSDIDCDGWVKTAADNGMRYVIITAKHHDGFCIWNTDTTEYSVKNTAYSTDVVAGVAEACKKYGLSLGIYYSLWDRNAASYKKDFKNSYLPYMRTQIRELLTNYGNVCELWLDGSWDKPAVEWELDVLYDMVKRINPSCQIGINHTIGRNTLNPEDRYLPRNCIEGDPIRMFPSDFRLWDPYPCAEKDPKIYTYSGKSYYLPFEMTICSREGFSWFNSSEYESKPFTDTDHTIQSCIRAFSQRNNVVINLPPGKDGRLSPGDVRHLEEIVRGLSPYVTRSRNDVIELQSELLRVKVRPQRGGNIASIYAMNKKTELLFQPVKDVCGIPIRGASFDEYEAAGFDDAFPNIDAEEIIYSGRPITYNDHGDIWTADMEVKTDNGELVLQTNNENYLFEKRIKLDNNRIVLKYMIENMSDRIYPCFYTMHCLFRYEENMRVVFPKEVTSVENAFTNETLGHVGQIHSYPVTEKGTDLTELRSFPDRSCVKFYAYGSVSEGNCSIIYPSSDIKVDIDWDSVKLPYLGLWVTKGGFRGEYNCAAEPSSGYYDSVSKAIKNDGIWELNPGEKKQFNITITVK